MTIEFEIKLSFSQAQLPKIVSYFVQKGAARRQRLQAYYFDTDNYLLSTHGIGLRLRKEGRYWLQTIKADKKSDFERYEHNAIAPMIDGNVMPTLDLERHRGEPAGTHLFELLDKQAKYQRLLVCFQTDVWRRSYTLERKTSCIEFACDEGILLAPERGDLPAVSEPIAEVEIELQLGSTADVFEQAKFFVRRFGAWIDTRSKAKRGFALAQRQPILPATLAKRVHLPVNSDDQVVVCTLLTACLSQIVPNAAQLAVSHEPFSDYEHHVHQLRVGLRRLKAVIKLLLRAQVPMPPDWAITLKQVFCALGQSRDHLVVNQVLERALQDKDAPKIKPLSGVVGPSLAEVVTQSNFQLLLLDLLTISQTPLAGSNTGVNLQDALVEILRDDYRKYQKKSKKFIAMEEFARHDLRKKLKEFRYNIEMIRDLAKSGKDYQSFNSALQSTLEILGRYNDLCVARDAFKGLLAHQPEAWYLLGWETQQEKQLVVDANRSLRRLFTQKFPF